MLGPVLSSSGRRVLLFNLFACWGAEVAMEWLASPATVVFVFALAYVFASTTYTELDQQKPLQPHDKGV